MPGQWKQGVGGLVRRYWRPRAAGSGREPLLPWTSEEVAAGVRHGIDDFDDIDVSNAFDALDETDGFAGSLGVGPHEPDDRDEPIDLAAMRADDALLDLLGRSDSLRTQPEMRRGMVDSELAGLLQSWRGEVDDEPIPELYSTDEAITVIARAGLSRQRASRRWLVPVASAAAVVVIGFTGMSVAARDAQPGDALWGLTQVFYADHARSVEAAAMVRTELNHASIELQQGHLGDARLALLQAQESLPSVDSSDGKADLQTQSQNLAEQLSETSQASTTQTSTSTSNGAPTSAAASSTPTTTTPVLPTTTTPPPTTTTTTVPPPTTTPPTSTTSSESAGTAPISTSDANTDGQTNGTPAAAGGSATGG